MCIIYFLHLRIYIYNIYVFQPPENNNGVIARSRGVSARSHR